MTTIQTQKFPPQANIDDSTTKTITPQHTQPTHVNIIEDKPSDHPQQHGFWTTTTLTTTKKQPSVTHYETTPTQVPIIENENRLINWSSYTYRESRTHGLIIEYPSSYALDTNKYCPDDPKWRTAWHNILDHHTEDFAPSWFCFKFPLQIKAPTHSTPRQHGKLQRKVIRELTRNIKDTDHYMAQSLSDRKKSKRHRDKQAQQQAQAASNTKQDKDRERYRK